MEPGPAPSAPDAHLEAEEAVHARAARAPSSAGEPVWALEEEEEAEEETVARAVAVERVGERRRPLAQLTRLEFLTDLIHFLRENGDGNLVSIVGASSSRLPSLASSDSSSAAVENPYLFPEKKLNQKQLDLFALYKQARPRRRASRLPF